jgi:hypothetical protein
VRVAGTGSAGAVNQQLIFGPFLALMVLTLVVWVYMYARRIPFITRSKLTPAQLTPLELARLSPPAVSTPSDNLKNLFEVPTLFYALCLYLFVTQRVDATYLVGAWIFVLFRVLHSLVHCTVNIVILRFWLYAISAVAFWFMVLRATFMLLK